MRSPHLKRGDRPPPRKKACQSCTKSKVRCDLERPVCSRCKSLGRPCEYPSNPPVSVPPTEPNYTTRERSIERTPVLSILGTPGLGQTSGMPIAVPYGLETPIWSPPIHPRRQVIRSGRELDLRNIDLVPSGNAEDIRDRWLRPYILPPLGRDEVPKAYHPFTLQYISMTLSTYPRSMLKDGDVPPIVHRLQVGRQMPPAMANCYSLVRMWEQAAAGSEALVVDTVEKEMERLANETPSLYDIDLLAAFQAYLIYSIMLYLSPLAGSPAITDKVMITLMEMAFRTARNGLFCAAEISHTRPSWESWIVAAAKRRTIFTMYLFCSVYNADRMLPNFIADEVKGVFAPEAKSLWEATDRETWEREYDRHLLSWEDGMLEISELWRSAETGTPQRRERIGRWLRTVDEFGMTMFGVTTHVHGC
ncbi:hypothetical protein BO70DRAFT_97343 [Aspergillus heteromorphus CBS 117.55]|uniref:Zn(2)-C6 fungal-type domain-containing protein n=1 Tax=Aspergillus heteromorphus CBS 117.55 TaxID=1448321 RepID=A0A317VM79_9EURO|nr:uncharacterized protein BO70DRAFT_97343 [Aspergillus heteromorphus CBS 117.55]PWY75456.1 hypothetical protein BO70DRAFT_97343 [Aspergillus heteromorphus CBS 117.55]